MWTRMNSETSGPLAKLINQSRSTRKGKVQMPIIAGRKKRPRRFWKAETLSMTRPSEIKPINNRRSSTETALVWPLRHSKKGRLKCPKCNKVAYDNAKSAQESWFQMNSWHRSSIIPQLTHAWTVAGVIWQASWFWPTVTVWTMTDHGEGGDSGADR